MAGLVVRVGRKVALPLQRKPRALDLRLHLEGLHGDGRIRPLCVPRSGGLTLALQEPEDLDAGGPADDLELADETVLLTVEVAVEGEAREVEGVGGRGERGGP